MSAPPIMPFDIPAYVADTMHLSNAQHGAYVLILMALWQHGGTVVDDDATLARIAKLTMDKWRTAAPSIRALLRPVEGGRLTQKRLAVELSRLTLRASKNSESGRLGGVAKSLKSKDPPLATATETLKRNGGDPKSGSNEPTLPLGGELDSESEIDSKKVRKKESNLATGRARGPHRLPDDWQPSQADLAYAINQHGFDERETAAMAEAFRDHHTHKGTLGIKWDAGWRMWVRNQIKFAAERAAGNPRNGASGHGGAPGKITPADLASGRYRRT